MTTILDLGTRANSYINITADSAKIMHGEIVDEALSCISVNGKELASIMCTPTNLDALAVGFLYNEGIISNISQISSLYVSDSKCTDVWLNFQPELPDRLIFTAGCGKGVTFDDLSKKHAPISITLQTTPNRIANLMKALLQGAESYKRARGIHTAALATVNSIELQVEDVGRHNAIDKLSGSALLNGLTTNGRILLTSGRVSSEMINKARVLQTPIVCSRTSPTSLSVALADAWNITLVGYVQQNRMRIYSHPERLIDVSLEQEPA